MRNWRHVRLTWLVLLLTSCGPAVGDTAGQVQEVRVETVPTVQQVATAAPTNTASFETKKAAQADLTPMVGEGLANCPVTQPPEPPFTPPPPNAPTAPWAGEFWYGTNLLWTRVPTSGMWYGLPHNPDGQTQKVFWWRQGYIWKEDPTPALTVTGRRLDAPAPPLSASEATNAYAEDIQSAMLVGVDFPTPGCWEITGKVADAELSFVIWVAP
jgi:hypothetical protein